jgi:dihydroorotate dehydrogenase electron transfer subunit
MAKRIESLKISDKTFLTNDIFLLELEAEKGLPEMRPGQFAEVKAEGAPDTFLRRPISVHDVDYQNKKLKFLVQIAGKGTKKLSELQPGDDLNIIYPLGNSFTIPEADSKVLLVGGGCGVAPLMFLARTLNEHGFNPDILLGFRSRERVIERDVYSGLGKVFVTTEDGSEGFKGLVTDHTSIRQGRYDQVYCCGPEPMMKAVSKVCTERGINCEVSLENLMGCGIGACLCCVVDTVKGHLCTCIDGPVFNIKDLKW